MQNISNARKDTLVLVEGENSLNRSRSNSPPADGGRGQLLKNEIFEQLRLSILEGHLAPGERLREERLARRFRVSRTPIREVLARLELEGLVELIPNRGATVRNFTLQQLRDTYDLRVLLEGYAARQAAMNLTAEDIAALRSINAEMEQLIKQYDLLEHLAERPPLIHRLVELNRRLHSVIANSSGNSLLPGLLDRIVQLPMIHRAMQLFGREGRLATLHQHRDLIRSFEARDPDWADAAMRTHIIHARTALLQSITDQPENSNEGGAAQGVKGRDP